MHLLANLVSQIKVGSVQHRNFVDVKKNKLIIQVCLFLEELGYITNFYVKGTHVRIFLKFVGGRSLLKDIELCSKSSKKIYISYAKLKSFSRYKIFILSTEYGLVTNKQALEHKVGGVVLISV